MPIYTVAAFILAAVFAVSAAAKLRQPAEVARAASDMLGRPLPTALGAAAIVLEFATAVMLVLRSTRAWGALAALVLLAAFSATIVRSLRAGRTPRCACFGSFSSAAISSTDLVRNGALMTLAVLTLFA